MKRKIQLFLGILLVCLAVPYRISATVGVVNGLTHERMAKAGDTYESIILIKNFGEEMTRIRIYPADYHFYADGRQFYSKPGELKRSNADWISFYPRSAVLSAGESMEVKYTVKIPDDETMNGTYWSLLMVEPIPEAPAEENPAQKNRVSYGITQVMRYAIQIITHIEDSGSRQIKFLNTQLLKEDEKKILQVDVENTGERWLRPALFVELYDEEGRHIGKFEGGKWRIYPGTSVRFKVDLSGVQGGKYKAMIVVDNLDEYVFGAEYSLEISSSSGSKRTG